MGAKSANLWMQNCLIKQFHFDAKQQHKILMMFAEGMLNKQIAYDLNVSEATIKAHSPRKSLYWKGQDQVLKVKIVSLYVQGKTE